MVDKILLNKNMDTANMQFNSKKCVVALPVPKKMSATWWPTIVAAGVGISAFPMCFLFTQICQSLHHLPMLLVALSIMGLALLLIIKLTHKRIKNKMYYGFALFVFTGIADLICGLESNGYLTGYMSLYLKYAEPYLWSAWGSMATYWDGTGFVVFYLIMGHCAANGKSYRSVGLHWSAAILNSMVVLLVSACLSESGLGWCTLINIVYVIFPVIVGAQCLAEPQQIRQKQQDRKLSWIDVLLVLLLLEAMLAAVVRGLAAFGSKQYIPQWHRTMVEPILMQESPAPFAAIQGLVTFFYFAPSFALLAWGLLKYPRKGWFLDLALITAGATSQAGVSMVGMSLHTLTKPEHKMPFYINHTTFFTFWAVNILIAIVPQLLVLRLLWLPADTIQGRAHADKIKKSK